MSQVLVPYHLKGCSHNTYRCPFGNGETMPTIVDNCVCCCELEDVVMKLENKCGE